MVVVDGEGGFFRFREHRGPPDAHSAVGCYQVGHRRVVCLVSDPGEVVCGRIDGFHGVDRLLHGVRKGGEGLVDEGFSVEKRPFERGTELIDLFDVRRPSVGDDFSIRHCHERAHRQAGPFVRREVIDSRRLPFPTGSGCQIGRIFECVVRLEGAPLGREPLGLAQLYSAKRLDHSERHHKSDSVPHSSRVAISDRVCDLLEPAGADAVGQK